MKSLFIVLLFITQSAFAIPVICESIEKTAGVSVLRLKINNKVRVNSSGTVWTKYLIGVSPRGVGEFQQIVYGSGDVRPDSINLTIVKENWVYGYVGVRSTEKNGSYEGKVRIAGVLRGKVIDVRCQDENPVGDFI